MSAFGNAWGLKARSSLIAAREQHPDSTRGGEDLSERRPRCCCFCAQLPITFGAPRPRTDHVCVVSVWQTNGD